MGKTDSKWFLCFRPSPTIEIDTAVDCSANRVLTYIAAVKKKSKEMKREKKRLKETRTKPSETAVPASDHLSLDNSSNFDRQNFSGFIRAAVTHTTTVKSDGFCQMATENATSGKPSVSVSSEVSAGLQRNSKDVSEGKRDQLFHRRREIFSGFRMNQVLLLVLFSLWMTVFCGKLLAVMTTTVGIYAWERRGLPGLVLSVLVNNDKITGSKTDYLKQQQIKRTEYHH